MHGYSNGQKEPVKKSWHFSLEEVVKRDISCETSSNENQLD